MKETVLKRDLCQWWKQIWLDVGKVNTLRVAATLEFMTRV